MEILFAGMLDKLGAGVVAADPNWPVLATTQAGKGGNVMAALRLAHMAYKVGGGAAEHGGVVAAGGQAFWKSSDA